MQLDDLRCWVGKALKCLPLEFRDKEQLLVLGQDINKHEVDTVKHKWNDKMEAILRNFRKSLESYQDISAF
jgi:hypothetical protein